MADASRSSLTPDAALLAAASGSAFAAIAAGQLANAVACRSSSRPAWVTGVSGNPLLMGALSMDALICGAFLLLPPLQDLLGGSWPPVVGLLGSLVTAAAVVLADGAVKLSRLGTYHHVARKPHHPGWTGTTGPQTTP